MKHLMQPSLIGRKFQKRLKRKMQRKPNGTKNNNRKKMQTQTLTFIKNQRVDGRNLNLNHTRLKSKSLLSASIPLAKTESSLMTRRDLFSNQLRISKKPGPNLSKTS